MPAEELRERAISPRWPSCCRRRAGRGVERFLVVREHAATFRADSRAGRAPRRRPQPARRAGAGRELHRHRLAGHDGGRRAQRQTRPPRPCSPSLRPLADGGRGMSSECVERPVPGDQQGRSDLLVLAPLRIEARAVRRGLGPGAHVLPTGMGPRHALTAPRRSPARERGRRERLLRGAWIPTLRARRPRGRDGGPRPGRHRSRARLRACSPAPCGAPAPRSRRTDRVHHADRPRRRARAAAPHRRPRGGHGVGLAGGRGRRTAAGGRARRGRHLRARDHRPLALVNGGGTRLLGAAAGRRASCRSGRPPWDRARSCSPRRARRARASSGPSRSSSARSSASVRRSTSAARSSTTRTWSRSSRRAARSSWRRSMRCPTARGSSSPPTGCPRPCASTRRRAGSTSSTRRAPSSARCTPRRAASPGRATRSRSWATRGTTRSRAPWERRRTASASSATRATSPTWRSRTRERVAYLTQTTLAVEETDEVVDALRERFPSLVGPASSDICYATQNRQDARQAARRRVRSHPRRRLRELLELAPPRRGRRAPRRERSADRGRVADRARLVDGRREHRPHRGSVRARGARPAGARRARRAGPRGCRRAPVGHRDGAVQAAARGTRGSELTMPVPMRQTARVGSYLMRQRLARREKFPLSSSSSRSFSATSPAAGCGKIQHPDHVLRRRMTVEQALGAIEESGAPMVSIAGGEPLIHPEIHVIASELVARKRFVYLCTNALLMERKLENFTPSPYFAWAVHMDGLRERHDASVEREGVFDKAVAAIRAAKARGFRVTTNTTFFTHDSPSTVRAGPRLPQRRARGRRHDDLAGLRLREGARPGALPRRRPRHASCSTRPSPTAGASAGA